jgi:hypothetical protein
VRGVDHLADELLLLVHAVARLGLDHDVQRLAVVGLEDQFRNGELRPWHVRGVGRPEVLRLKRRGFDRATEHGREPG